MDGKGCYCWNDTNNVYVGHWLERNRHGDGVYLIVTKPNRYEEKDKETQHTIFRFTCGKWKNDYVLKDRQIKFVKAL